jgi:hypothetical protein
LATRLAPTGTRIRCGARDPNAYRVEAARKILVREETRAQLSREALTLKHAQLVRDLALDRTVRDGPSDGYCRLAFQALVKAGIVDPATNPLAANARCSLGLVED